MPRRFWLLFHRYAGLGMAVFLVLVGLTGSILAFNQELNEWLNPQRDRVAVQSTPLLGPFALREIAQKLVPDGYNSYVDLHVKADRVYEIMFAPPVDSSTGKYGKTGYVTLKLDPYTGAELSRSDPSIYQPSYWPLHRGNIMDFIWHLHVQLVMGHTGSVVLGIVALVWVIDCFVGFYLTLPVRSASGHEPRVSRISRWRTAWKVKWPTSFIRLNFDLHRAGGLLTWVMLFMFAWSSGTFNLPEVFHPVNDFAFGKRPEWKSQVVLSPRFDPPVDLRTALTIGQQLMAEQSRVHRFKVLQDRYIAYNPEGHYYSFGVNGDALFGVQDTTYITFDAEKQQVLFLYMPSGLHASVTLINWLSGLHTAAIWGLPYQVVVCVMGLVITMLSLTGVYIWWKKRVAKTAMAARGRMQAARTGAQQAPSAYS